MKNFFYLLLGSVLFTSCVGYKDFTPKSPRVYYTKITGAKLVPETDIRTNVYQLKYSYKRLFPSKLYLFLENKRNLNDSLGRKNSGIHFLNNYNSSFNEAYLSELKHNISVFYRKNGFLNSSFQVKVDSTLAKQNLYGVTIEIHEGSLSLFTKEDSILVNNPVIHELTQNYLNKGSIVYKNTGLQAEVLQKEKEELAKYLKDRGYYYFSASDIGLYLNDLKDTTLQKVGLIYKIPDAKGVYSNKFYDRLFRFSEPEFLLKKAINSYSFEPVSFRFSQKMKELVKIQANDLYATSRVNEGLQNIYLTDQFKSVSVRFDTSKTTLSPHIELVESDKLNFTSEIGGSVFRGIPGPFLTNSFKIRRVTSSLDYLDFSVRLGYEAQAGFINTSQTRNNLELNFTTSLNYPDLYFGKKVANWFGDYYAPQTQIGIGYDYINRPEYVRANAKIFQRFNWRKSNNKFFQLSLLDVNLINTSYPNTSISSDFQNYLEELKFQGNNLFRSFYPSFVSSIHFNYNLRNFSSTNSLVNGYTLNLGMESGGTILNLLPEKRIQFINSLFNYQQDIQFFRFLRLNVDYRKYKLLGYRRNAQLAFKISSGVAYAYGAENNYQLPYEKNFFIGGPSSLRAWKPRRLGPGANSTSQQIEQPGSILLESSLELRFKMFKLFGTMNGAFFIDAGNIWNFSNGTTAQETVFKLDEFYNQIAVGTGFGLRWDFNYFLLRLDLATKAINPANPEKKKWVLPKTSFQNGENPIEFNIGIGYPF